MVQRQASRQRGLGSSALIEHLENDGWQTFFSEVLGFALWVLRNDRHRLLGSSADDLRAWLVAGGIPRIRHHLETGMEMREFPETRNMEVRKHINTLAVHHLPELIALALYRIIPTSGVPVVGGVSGAEIEDALRRILRRERPFEEWMNAHKRTYENVIEIYRDIDKWLLDNGIVTGPGPLPKCQ